MRKDSVPLLEAARIAKNFGDFIKLIAYDTWGSEFRNPLADEYRKVFDPGRSEVPWHGNVENFCARLEKHLEKKGIDISGMTMAQMCILVNGQEWTDRYELRLNTRCEDYMFQRYLELHRQATGEKGG